MELKNIVGINLKYIRFNAGLSQEEFYHKLGLSTKYLASVERGEINFTIKFLEKLAKNLNVEINELIEFDKNKIIKHKRIDAKKARIN